ncbi:hypothetical protein FB567DRAFT_517958 [Paraphoma chrysanthemicola]|uniref:Uncharacterized protein n=1 Tax=Paraphoma chrysanthemicola TaxID=798071 RepID=A0A8K0W1U9_9PLEO|nr:hypothetical protein FB567DRAFT_517958 [Paraphoma chrysanthemicola]
MASLLVFLAFATINAATAATDPDIENDPSGKQGWYSAPNYRGTLDIVWPCILTVFLCCWTAVHPNIPSPKSKWWHRYADRSIGLFVGVVAPEMIIYFALEERSQATKSVKKMSPIIGADNWSVSHAFNCRMGGFVIDVGSVDQEYSDSTHCGYINQESIALCFENGRICQDTWVTAKEICDKGKADNLIKALTVIQILWLVVQCIARVIQHLPLTTLELSTLAYIPCATLMYLLWWDKPYEVNVPTPVQLIPQARPHDVVASGLLDTGVNITGVGQRTESVSSVHAGAASAVVILESRKEDSLHAERNWIDTVKASVKKYELYPMLQSVLSDKSDKHNNQSEWTFIFLSAVFFVVGAIHLAAWNLAFATSLEQSLWRVCSLVTTFVFPLLWFTVFVVDLVLERDEPFFNKHSSSIKLFKRKWLDRYIWLPLLVALVSYCLARLYLIVELFVGLRATPKAAFKTPEWSKFVPHFG